MSSSNVKCSETSSAKGGPGSATLVTPDEVQVSSKDEKDDRNDGKPSEEHTKSGESSSSTPHIQPTGAGRHQIQRSMQRRKQIRKKSFSEPLQKGPVNNEQTENTGSSKQRNNQQKAGNQSNLSRGSSQTSLTDKINNMVVSDTRRPNQNGSQTSGNNQNRSQNIGRNQNQWQPSGVSQSNYQANGRLLMTPQNILHFPPNGHCSKNTPYQTNPGSPTQLVQVQAFPSIPYPGNEIYRPHSSAPNSPGPINPPGEHSMRPDLPLTRSPSLTGPEMFKNYFHRQAGPNSVIEDLGNYPLTHANRPLVHNSGFVSPQNLNGARSKFQDNRNMEPGNQQNISGKTSQNGNVMGNQGSDGFNQKKQGSKGCKKNYNQSAPPTKGKRHPHPVTINAVGHGGPMIHNNRVMGPMHNQEQLQYFNSEEVFVSQSNFVPVQNSGHPPMMSPVSTAPFQQYVDEQQYDLAIYHGGNYVPQHWVPMSEGLSNFVPYRAAEMVPYTMGPGVIPHSTVPYSVPPNMMPYTNGPNMVPYTSGVSDHGFVPAVPPPGPANLNAQSLSFTASSRVGPFTSTTEGPKHQFNLSQLERAWEENSTQQKAEANSQTHCKELVEDYQRHQKGRIAEDQHQRKGAEWLPENLKKMLDVSSLEKLQRMSSTNGKRVPMNARNKESPNHMPAAAPPDVQEEVIKFICDSWNKVYQEYQKGSPTVTFHVDSDPCTLPEGFVPFDLEAYWGQRLVQNMTTQNIPTQNM